MIPFYKYQGAGNDFIIIDARKMQKFLTTEEINKMCDRRFGIGADGLMILKNKQGYDFQMQYYNSDGNEGSMCGNGGRCIVAFAKKQGIIEKNCHFLAIDGGHDAEVITDNKIRLQMSDVEGVKPMKGGYFLDTGSPHFVLFKDDIDTIDVFKKGRKLRNDPVFMPGGTNVNFVEIRNDSEIYVRTYERGVEDETLACGTGVTAAAISTFIKTKSEKKAYDIAVKGGNLRVEFKAVMDDFTDVWLAGPAEYVFEGSYNLD